MQDRLFEERERKLKQTPKSRQSRATVWCAESRRYIEVGPLEWTPDVQNFVIEYAEKTANSHRINDVEGFVGDMLVFFHYRITHGDIDSYTGIRSAIKRKAIDLLRNHAVIDWVPINETMEAEPMSDDRVLLNQIQDEFPEYFEYCQMVTGGYTKQEAFDILGWEKKAGERKISEYRGQIRERYSSNK